MSTQQYLGGMEAEERNLGLSQLFTPPPTAKRIAHFALSAFPKSSAGSLVLEPSCGHGALMKALKGYTHRKISVVGVDIDRLCVAVCERAFPDDVVLCRDFLTVDPKELPKFAAVVTNPPYEDGKAEAHIMHALNFAPRVIAHVPLTTLESAGRLERMWRHVDILRMAVCASRPKYEGDGGKTAQCTLDVQRKSGKSPKVELSWWP